MRKKTILEKIISWLGFGGKEEPETQKGQVAQYNKTVKKKEVLTGLEKPKSYINKEYTNEEIKRKAKLKELEGRKINLCFIPELQNGINIRSMLEYMYRELPKKAPQGYSGKLRYYMWSKTRKIMEKQQRKEVMLENLDGTPFLDENGRKQYKEIFTCEICGESGEFHQGKGHHTECHEEWEFNDKYKTARLKKMWVLCPECHAVAHINRSLNDEQKFTSLKIRYCYYNGLLLQGQNGLEPDFNKFQEDYDFAVSERDRRSGKRYNLDVSLWYKKFHYSIEKDNKAHYFDIKNGNVRFRTDDIEYLEFVLKEFNNNEKKEGE